MRERLNDTRKSVTHKLVIRYARPNGKTERLHFYITVGFFPDGRPAELFITVNNGNETIAGFCKVWALAISLCLQSGVTVAKLFDKFAFQDFEPKGFTEGVEIKTCKSVVDYITRWMMSEFGKNK
jgi:ribonucleoside-diphosphate reductase alpha chain